LEKHFGWTGIIVEANPRWYKEICHNRECIAVNYAAFSKPGVDLEFVDAGAVGGLVSHLQNDIHANLRRERIGAGAVIKVPTDRVDNILKRYGAPGLIDYMSIDTEGSELEVLKSINFNMWRICLLTIEHGGVEQKRKSIAEYLLPYGYKRQRIWFEDWYYHPNYLAELLQCDEREALQNLDLANAYIPYTRRTTLIQTGYKKRQEGSPDKAFEYFDEAIKPYYPDNTVAYIEVSKELLLQKKREAAITLLKSIAPTRPNHQALLKHSIVVFAQERRNVLLIRAIQRAAKHHPDIINDPSILEAIKSRIPDLVSLLNENKVLKKENPMVLSILSKGDLV
jgi:FkbM family methyltransferase